MKNLVKTWLRRNRKGTYVYCLRWIGEDGREKYQSLGHADKKERLSAKGVKKNYSTKK